VYKIKYIEPLYMKYKIMKYFDNRDYVWDFEKGGWEFQKPIPIKMYILNMVYN
jgi:hypothetical protein